MTNEPKVTVFMPSYSEKQQRVLSAFAHGVPHAHIRSLSDPYAPCDIAVIFGLYKKSYKATWDKKKVLDKHQGDRLIVIDSSFVNRGEYWNVGFGGINGHADFRTGGVSNDRWQMLGVRSKPWRKQDTGPVIVCGQVPWDTAVQDVEHAAWCREAINYYTKRGVHVIFRPHPRVGRGWKSHYGNIDPRIVDHRPLKKTLAEARCVVTWNSNTAVDAAIIGVPVIAQDRGSMAYSIAGHEFSDYDKPYRPSRRQWLANIGYSQWTLEEMMVGDPWKHLTRSGYKQDGV